jgi:hypothetical protein
MAWLSALCLRHRMECPLDAVKESHRINFTITVFVIGLLATAIYCRSFFVAERRPEFSCGLKPHG